MLLGLPKEARGSYANQAKGNSLCLARLTDEKSRPQGLYTFACQYFWSTIIGTISLQRRMSLVVMRLRISHIRQLTTSSQVASAPMSS